MFVYLGDYCVCCMKCMLQKFRVEPLMESLCRGPFLAGVPHPLGILRLADAPYLPAVDKYARYVAKSFENLRLMIKRHEDAVVWGA